MDQLHWHHAHNEAFRRIGGVPAVLRIDNLKTGDCPAGPDRGARSTRRTASTASAVGFHIDACLPRSPEHKGKVESKVRFVRRHLRLVGSVHHAGRPAKPDGRAVAADSDAGAASAR